MISKVICSPFFCFRKRHNPATNPDNNPTAGSCKAYIQNHIPPPAIKKLIVSVINPITSPTTGPKYQPITITGIHARDIDKANGAILIVIRPKTSLRAISIAIKNNKRTERKDLIGEKGKKNFFTCNLEFFISF
ncbi:MAG: hypothetical protein MJ233_00900 [Mycoplasmoidaceae bacterium]|nr:hypothetical protein [Mycoplasmoidaceae bacterium]